MSKGLNVLRSNHVNILGKNTLGLGTSEADLRGGSILLEQKEVKVGKKNKGGEMAVGLILQNFVIRNTHSGSFLVAQCVKDLP